MPSRPDKRCVSDRASRQPPMRAVQAASLATLLTVLAALPAHAAPTATVLNTNTTLHLVNTASNAETLAGSLPFSSDSLARSPGGTLFAADPGGVLWDVTGPPIPVGPTLQTQIADLAWAGGGLWGYSNASQQLFFFDLGTSSVTYTATLSLPASLSPSTIVTGVAPQSSSGDVFLSAYDGLNNDVLLRVPAASSTALMVGSLAHGDSFSYVSDIEFDASGSLIAMTWFHRWFYGVNPASAATSLLSAGPHRDSTAMALSPVPEPAAGLLLAAGLAVLAMLSARRQHNT